MPNTVKPVEQKHRVIYVPGLGDDRTYGQDVAIAWWRCLGVVGSYHAVGWARQEPFEAKLQRLLDEIDLYFASGDAVSLIGFSAGASAVINAFAARPGKLAGAVCISGKIRNPSNVAPALYSANPAFRESLELAQQSLLSLTNGDKMRLRTVYPLRDMVVLHQDAIIPGVKEMRTIAFTHPMSVAVALTFYAPILARFLKRSKSAT